jgi:ATP-dependent Clp protease ATP-binding subunit ClpA
VIWSVGCIEHPVGTTLKRLGDALKLQDSDLERFTAACHRGVHVAVSATAATRSAVPVPLTSFVGREQEVERLGSLFNTTRLLTLVGTGGVGKTRLALRLAFQLVMLHNGPCTPCPIGGEAHTN